MHLRYAQARRMRKKPVYPNLLTPSVPTHVIQPMIYHLKCLPDRRDSYITRAYIIDPNFIISGYLPPGFT